MRQDIIRLTSSATKKNWIKLKSDPSDKLKSRANKTLSRKSLVPVEYFSDNKNIQQILNLTDLIKQNQWNIFSSILSLGINLLKRQNISEAPHVKTTLSEYGHIKLVPDLLNISLPDNEIDVLGLIYQCLLSEGEKNQMGSYYTPHYITSRMTDGIDFSQNQTFLDPCCGSGAFLLALNTVSPSQIFGIDNDPIAVLIAKINLLIKYKNNIFSPQIFCCDFLKEPDMFSQNDMPLSEMSFNYIISNPPWGAACAHSKESFSCFFEKAYSLLKKNGVIKFLLPVSFLNIKAHKDIRNFLFSNGEITRITLYNKSFTGVMTKFVDIEYRKKQQNQFIILNNNGIDSKINCSQFLHCDNFSQLFLTEEDIQLIEHIRSFGRYDLSNSDWALGIVTGDNKNLLHSIPFNGCEPIYTGKEITPYTLNPAQKYILYDTSKFQQVAKEKYYRASEKLVYKFITDKLIFAYDCTGSLCLNSANILIPHIPGMSTKTVMAFLNSEVLQYFYKISFQSIKVLKGNLCKIPFPAISTTQDDYFTSLVNRVLSREPITENISDAIYEIYNITPTQKKRIKRTLYGTID